MSTLMQERLRNVSSSSSSSLWFGWLDHSNIQTNWNQQYRESDYKVLIRSSIAILMIMVITNV